MNFQNKKRDKKKNGFTLVELIVVIALLAILSASAVVAYGNISEQAKKASENADGQTIARTLNTYNTLAENPINDTTNELPTDLATLNKTLQLNSVTKKDLISMDLSIKMDAKRYETKEFRDRITFDSSNTWIYTPAT